MKMKTTRFLTAMCVIALTGASFAGIKYWDNQAFKAYDVGDYVQDGLVLNYDGIRNAGPTADHDSSATTWKNLGSVGATYDMSIGGPATSSAWGADGFAFAGDAYFRSASKHTLSEYYEIQSLVDAKASDATGIGYVYSRIFADAWNSSDGAWNRSSIAVRPEFSQNVSGTTYKGSLVFNTHYYTDGRPLVPTSVATTFDYMTALGESKSASIFIGLDVPTEMPGRASPQSGAWSAQNPARIYLGGHEDAAGTGVGEALTGTVKNFRYYSRVLSANERAWNRVVDEARYFNRKAALPVTNVVVRSNCAPVYGDQPSGNYAVDASGFTFTAMASKTYKGRNYTCAGYTLETWNDSTGAWGEPEAHDGELSCTATSSSRIRITWRWTPGAGLIAYDADDYVQDGLVLHYDGIRNAGLGAPHDSAATNWVNLGSAGAAYDMTRYSLVSSAMVEGAATGSWADTGFVFAKNAFFYESAALPVSPYYTLQTAIEATANDQNGIGYVMSPSKANNHSDDPLRFSIGIRDTKFIYEGVELAYSFYHNAMDATGGRPAVAVELNETVNYGTAMLDHTNGVFFTGTTPPWNATGASNGHAVKTTGSASSRTYNGLTLGGTHGETGNMLAGTLHGFRYYNRLLEDDELVWNRIVDNARYFAANVTVASTRSDVQGNEPDGEYGVSGSYTFTAPASVTVGNVTYEPAGYAIQSWSDADGCWGAATEYEGASYSYTTAAGKVRLLWRWKAVRGIRAAADYDVSDYVSGGLVLNFDGIRNVGATDGHDSSATTWVNLGTDGAKRNAPISKTSDLAWTANGYMFDGTRKFVATSTGVGTASHTVQLLTDAVQNEQQGYAGVEEPSNPSIFFFSGAQASFATATSGGSFYYRIQGVGNDTNLRFSFDKTQPLGYVTAITDAAAKKAYVFQSDEKPTTAPGVKSYDSIAAPSFGELAIGGWGGGTSQYMKGTINYFRYYDRVLSDAELAQNRQVDVARYSGALSVTNVFVVAGNGAQAEGGAYKVEGEWTFTATTVVNKRKDTVPVVRYTIETLVNGVWTDKRTYDGNSYTYTEGTSPATVRLRWYGQPEGVVFVVR